MDWTKLPSDVWVLIGSKLEAAADRVRLRAVSKYFISFLPAYQPIWLMLSQDRSGEFYEGDAMRRLLLEDDDQEPRPPRRGFIPVGEQIHIHELYLPDAEQKRCVSSAGSWIVTVDLDRNISLFNIFSRLQIDLPSQRTFEADQYMAREGNPSESDLINGFLKKLVFSSFQLTNSKDWSAMAIYSSRSRLAFCRRGDTTWTELNLDIPVEFDVDLVDCEDIIYFRGRFHMVDIFGEVAAFNMDKDNKTCSWDLFSGGKRHPGREFVTRGPHYRRYLVEWMGELLLVKRRWFPDNIEGTAPHAHPPHPPHVTCQFQVFRRDFVNHEWIKLNDLGQYCLFLGLNTSVAVSVLDYPLGSLKKNCIYFTANKFINHFHTGGRPLPQIADDMGIFSLEDDSIQPLYHGICTPSCLLPIWIIPHPFHN